MPDSEIRFVGDLQRLDLRPGEGFVLTMDDYLTSEQAARIQEAWVLFCAQLTTEKAPPLLLLGSGMTLGAVKIEDAPNG